MLSYLTSGIPLTAHQIASLPLIHEVPGLISDAGRFISWFPWIHRLRSVKLYFNLLLLLCIIFVGKMAKWPRKEAENQKIMLSWRVSYITATWKGLQRLHLYITNASFTKVKEIIWCSKEACWIRFWNIQPHHKEYSWLISEQCAWICQNCYQKFTNVYKLLKSEVTTNTDSLSHHLKRRHVSSYLGVLLLSYISICFATS